MIEILSLILFVAILALAWHLISIRERALEVAKLHCQKIQVQFLDGSVRRDAFRLARNTQGIVSFRQTFLFEFTSTGEKRYQGQIVFIGSKLISMELEPHIVNEPETLIPDAYSYKTHSTDDKQSKTINPNDPQIH